jgi:hypothetical protein
MQSNGPPWSIILLVIGIAALAVVYVRTRRRGRRR